MESTIIWEAHGTYGRARGSARKQPSWLFPLQGFTEIDPPITLSDLRGIEAKLRSVQEALSSTLSGRCTSRSRSVTSVPCGRRRATS
jgi:hypothetical protein